MKRTLMLSLVLMASFSSFAQTKPVDTNYITRLISLDWMPDGKNMLVFLVKFPKIRTPGGPQTLPETAIFSLNPNTKQATLLMKNGGGPAISHDGKTIAFDRREPGSFKSRIFLFDIATGKETPIAQNDTSGKSSPQWSPDDKQILFTKEFGKGRTSILDVCILDIASGNIKQITPTDTHKHYNPMWSPDGKWIVYYLEKGDNRDQVYLTDPAGSFQKNLTNDTSTHNFYPSWAGKDKIIYTWSPNRIAIIDKDGKNREVIDGVSGFYARYNFKTGEIGYILQNKLMVYDAKNKTSVTIGDDAFFSSLL